MFWLFNRAAQAQASHSAPYSAWQLRSGAQQQSQSPTAEMGRIASSGGQRLAQQNLEAAAAGPGTDTAHPKARSLPPAARLQPLGKR